MNNEINKEDSKLKNWFIKEDAKAWATFYKEQQKEQERYFKLISGDYKKAFALAENNYHSKIKSKINYSKNMLNDMKNQKEIISNVFSKEQIPFASSADINTNLFNAISSENIFSEKKTVDTNIWKDKMNQSVSQMAVFGNELKATEDYTRELKSNMNTFAASNQQALQLNKGIYDGISELIRLAKIDM